MQRSSKREGEERGKATFSVTKDAQWFVFSFTGIDRSGIRPLDPQIVRLQLERGELVALARETHSFILKIIQLSIIIIIIIHTYYFKIELLIFKL